MSYPSRITRSLRFLAMVSTLLGKMVAVGVLVEYRVLKNRATSWLRRTWRRFTEAKEPNECRECSSMRFHDEQDEAWAAPRYNCAECGAVHVGTLGGDWRVEA